MIGKKLHLSVLAIISFVAVTLKAQPYGNEWIDYSQKYYKLKITQDGMYRIDSTALANAGIPLSTVDPRNIQLFGRGVEQYIYIQGESDGVFNGTDFIEFYGKRNDGYLDSSLYININFPPNPYISLFNDTATYFITWNSSFSNKRMTLESDVSFGSYIPVNYFFKEEVKAYYGSYYEGQTDGVGGTDAQYTEAEGFFDTEINLGNSRSYAVTTPNIYPLGPDAIFKTVVVGASKANSVSPDHHLTIEYQNMASSWIQLTDIFFDGYKSNKFSYTISPSQLGSVTNVRYASIAESNYVSNRTAVSYIYSKYPHTVDMEGKTSFRLLLPDNTSQAKSFLDISNYNPSSSTVRFYDLTNHKRITIVANASNYNVLVPNSGNEKECFITSDNQIQNISSIKPVASNGLFTDLSANAPDSAFIMVTHKTLLSEVMNYATYRNSIAGGSYDVVVADIDELYDQFAYGVNKHPFSIRRFADYALDTWPSDPKHLFLIGKSIHARDYKYDPFLYSICLVPSIGNPSSDVLFTAGLNGTMFDPEIPTGRLSANKASDVAVYLNKVKEYESNGVAEWMKHVLHFGGGGTAKEQETFVNYLNIYESIIEDTSFGGFVHTFLKTTSAPIQITLSDSVKNLINNGVSIMTFFGHASGGSFDQNIDSPSSYSNTGKYPVIIANSCYSGDIHQYSAYSSSTTSEDFTFSPGKGSIGFIASVGLGVPNALNQYTSELYRNISSKFYGKSIGKCMKEAVKATQGNGEDIYIKATCLEMTLHGDPAVVVNAHDLPDYLIDNSSVSFLPENVSTEIDSFKVNVLVKNIGKATNNQVTVELKRVFPDGSSQVINKTLSSVYYQSNFAFTLPVEKTKGIGLNKFEVRIDPLNQLAELSETNNNVTVPPVDLLIVSDDISPIYPYKYAIYPNDSVVLKGSTGNLFAGQRKYIFEIDTAYTFDSPFKRLQTVTMAGGVINALPSAWLPSSLLLTDSSVYYWRVKVDTTAGNSKWKTSSFQYIKNKNGWEQAHFFQYKDNDYSYIVQDSAQRKFDFVSIGKTLTCRTIGQIPPNYIYSQLYETGYKLDITLQDYAGCTVTPAIHIAVIDPITLVPWGTHWIDKTHSVPIHYNPTHSFGNLNDTTNCRNSIDKYFIFQTNSLSQMQGMKKMITDSIPNGYYILAYTWIKGNFQSWADPTAIGVFTSLGADSIQNIPNDRPYIFFTKKGDLSSTLELIGDSADADISLSAVLNSNSDFGTITSGLIGPSLSWDSLSWRHHSVEVVSSDTVTLNITGIDKYGVENTVLSNISTSDIYFNIIDAATYPYLKLSSYMRDGAAKTAAQMDKWQIFYEPVPEAAINPNHVYNILNNDTVQEGDDYKVAYAIENISEYDFTDSLLITYWIEDHNKVKHTLPDKLKTPPFSGGEIVIDTVIINSLGYPGTNALWIEVNPINHINSQLEQYHFNNLAKINFSVKTDNQNPLLDVTFDGQHILNGDIVSVKPDILIQLKDENKFLALNDTSSFAIYLKKPGTPVDQRIYFGSEMSFVPAVLPKNSCKINYKPNLLQDGMYQLTVQAKDKSNNLSGAIDYKINFEVINKSTITEVLNYPNPFTTSTRFVFTITGSQIPDYFKIQIMTITGKVVKEISKDELGPLRIGRNITDYAWDGTDDFGDRLANGVYLYRVLTQLNGSAIEKRETEADSFFKKGFGKMYLMR